MRREPASRKTKGNGASRLSSHPRLTPLLARGQPSSLRSSFLRLSPHYAPQAGAGTALRDGMSDGPSRHPPPTRGAATSEETRRGRNA